MVTDFKALLTSAHRRAFSVAPLPPPAESHFRSRLMQAISEGKTLDEFNQLIEGTVKNDE